MLQTASTAHVLWSDRYVFGYKYPGVAIFQSVDVWKHFQNVDVVCLVVEEGVGIRGVD